MRTIARLFGKSPFAPLQTHMNRVTNCMEKLTEIISLVTTSSKISPQKLIEELCRLEHEADITKNDIRNNLPKSIFLPIDRSQFLEILSLQDSIADQAEEIGITLTLRPLSSAFLPTLAEFYQKNVDTFISAQNIIREIDQLIESSFGGIEAEKVKTMVEYTAHKEQNAKNLARALKQQIFSSEQEWSPPEFYVWVQLIDQIGNISLLSEKLANRIRMVLELK
ncbi:MAG: TIGR00153 family protein [Rhabdochlamydiaceae bacterium]